MLTYKIKVKYTLSLGEFSFYDPLQPTEILEDSKLSPFLMAKKRWYNISKNSVPTVP